MEDKYQSKWWRERIARHGSVEAVRAEMRRMALLSAKSPERQKGNFKGGFAKMKLTDPKRMSEIAREGARKRWQD